MNREAQGMLMFVVGGALLRASVTDLYLRYVKAGLRPLLLAAGVFLIVAAIATIWYELRSARRSSADRAEPETGHHGHREPRVAWLLVLPVFAIILIAPPALGSYAANRAGTALQQPAGYATLPTADPVQISVLDYATRAVYDHGHSLGDRQVKLTGFITVGGRGAPYLTRMILSCCAADAQPIKVGLSGKIPPELRPDSWLEVTGTYTDKQTKDEVNGGPIPFIDISATKPIPPPHDQYES